MGSVQTSLFIPTIRPTEDWLNHVLRFQKLSVIMEMRYFSVSWIFQLSTGSHIMRFPLFFLPTNNLSDNDLIISEELLQHGWFQHNVRLNPFGNLPETIFCSRHDEIKISCSAPTLCDGFGSSNAHHPVSLTYAGFHVTHIKGCSPRTQLDFNKTNYPLLM